jgi:Nuclease-related domain
VPNSRHSARIATHPAERDVHVDPAARTSAYTPRHAAKARTAPEVTAPPAESMPPVVPAPQPGSALSPDRDLALNPPAAAARCEAAALRDATPTQTFLSRTFGPKGSDGNSRVGADAELEIAEMLQVLDGRWRVLHAVPLGDRGNDIDHLVVGPAGVFTVDIKHHPEAKVWVAGETFKVNGRNQRYVRNCRQAAARAAKLLSAKAQFDVDVRGVIAVVGTAHGLMVKEQPADGTVSVVTAAMLVKHLESLPNVLGAPSRERIYEVARHLSTWQPKTVSWTEF